METKLNVARRDIGRCGLAVGTMLVLAGQASAQQGMVQQELADLSTLAPEQEVAGLRYCDGVYHVTTAAGDALEFPVFNLRFKTDAGEMGPPQGTPAPLAAGMMGDRAFVIFAEPEEISRYIERGC